MRQVGLSVVFVAALAIVGALLPAGAARAAYNGKSVGCPTGTRTCSSYVARGIEGGDTYYAVGKSDTSINISEAFAWVRGTNMYHIGSVLDEEA